MPTYCFQCPRCGTRFETVLAADEPHGSAPCACGALAERDFRSEHRTRHGHGWPLHSDALACDPGNVLEAQEAASTRGVPTEFDREGRPVFTSREHRKQFCEAFGYIDRNAGYGDAAPRMSDRERAERRAKATSLAVIEED